MSNKMIKKITKIITLQEMTTPFADRKRELKKLI